MQHPHPLTQTPPSRDLPFSSLGTLACILWVTVPSWSYQHRSEAGDSAHQPGLTWTVDSCRIPALLVFSLNPYPSFKDWRELGRLRGSLPSHATTLDVHFLMDDALFSDSSISFCT